MFDAEAIVTDVARGNKAAFDFLTVFWWFCHWIDDQIDRDHEPLPDQRIVRNNLEVLMTFAVNPFFQEHKNTLLPLIITGVHAYADSLRWAGDPDPIRRKAACVLKSQYQEVLWWVAYLVGGHEHMQAMTEKYRQYDFDLPEAAEPHH